MRNSAAQFALAAGIAFSLSLPAHAVAESLALAQAFQKDLGPSFAEAAVEVGFLRPIDPTDYSRVTFDDAPSAALVSCAKKQMAAFAQATRAFRDPQLFEGMSPKIVSITVFDYRQMRSAAPAGFEANSAEVHYMEDERIFDLFAAAQVTPSGKCVITSRNAILKSFGKIEKLLNEFGLAP